MNNINGLGNILNQKLEQNENAQDLKLSESAKQLEGVFLQYFLKPMEEAMTKGIIAGYPVVDVKAELYDGSYHDVDSSEMAFKIAGSICFQNAVKQANPVLLEPVMDVEVTVPEDYFGDVMGNINSRRGQISESGDRGLVKFIKAKIPLAEMFGYATDLRSMTQGRGNYTMEFGNYDKVPNNVAEEIISKRTAPAS